MLLQGVIPLTKDLVFPLVEFHEVSASAISPGRRHPTQLALVSRTSIAPHNLVTFTNLLKVHY